MERKINNLLGFSVDSFDFDSALFFAEELIKSKKGGYIVTINPEMIEYGLKSKEYAEILNNANLILPDGVGIKIGLKIKGVNTKRIAGIEFAHALISECVKNNLPIGLIGARPHVITKTIENLKSEFEKINIVYSKNGYFQDEKKVLSELKVKKPKFVLVALGFPKQEEFIVKAREFLPEALMIGIGGSFDVWAGEVKRAPKVFQKTGLEWLYRTIKEPKRFKRIFPALPRFLFRVLFSKWEMVKDKRNNSENRN